MRYFLTWMTLASNLAIAGEMGTIETPITTYIKIGSGGSYSLNTAISTNPVYWDVSPEGYGNNLGHSALYSAAVGYQHSELVSIDVEYIYRPSFSYAKYQTSTAINTVFFNGNKTRYFDFQSNSLMANINLHGSQLAQTLWCDYRLQPFFGAGLGVAFNSISNFHSVKNPAVTNYFVAAEQDTSRTSLAWQVSAGLEVLKSNLFSLDAGYRYYSGGTFASNTFVINTQDYGPPWKGNFNANEFFVRISKFY